PSHATSRGASDGPRGRAATRRAHRERLSCRRRQPPSIDPLRERERARGREAGRSRDPPSVRRGRRLDHRRTRRGHGEELLHALAVQRGRSGDDGTGEDSVRSTRSFESGKDLPHPGALSRVPARRHAVKGAIERLHPADAAACARAVADAASASRSIRIRGAGTKDYMGEMLPTDAVLDTTALNGVVAHVPADLTVTVAAGTRLADVRAALARAGQFLPLDPPHAHAATIGGVVAANSTGFWRSRYGGVRDLLIGTTAVLGDGTIAHSGGRVVKNVAGY